MARVRSGAMFVSIDGLPEMLKGLEYGAREIADVWRDILRGPFGQEFERELLARMSDSRRTGYTMSRVKVNDDGSEGVQIGIPSGDTATHPASKRANARSIGVWLESGTRMHMIPTKVTRYNHMRINGRFATRFPHPGTRAPRPMFRVLQLYRADAERLFERELDRRLAVKMGLH